MSKNINQIINEYYETFGSVKHYNLLSIDFLYLLITVAFFWYCFYLYFLAVKIWFVIRFTLLLFSEIFVLIFLDETRGSRDSNILKKFTDRNLSSNKKKAYLYKCKENWFLIQLSKQESYLKIIEDTQKLIYKIKIYLIHYKKCLETSYIRTMQNLEF